jgi:hypothetical protein
VRTLLVLAAAMILVPAASARPGGGTVDWTVPAPAMGKGEVVAFSATGPRSSPPLLVKVTNLKLLGQGFGGVAIVTKIRGGSEVFLVMFMGNLSKKPAPTVKLEISTPSTIKSTPVGNVCKDYQAWTAAFPSSSNVAKKGTEILQGLIPNGPDKPNVFLGNMGSAIGC